MYTEVSVVSFYCPIRWGTTEQFSLMVMIIQDMTSQGLIESILGWALRVFW